MNIDKQVIEQIIVADDTEKLVSEAAFSAPVSAPKVKKPALPKAEKTPNKSILVPSYSEGYP